MIEQITDFDDLPEKQITPLAEEFFAEAKIPGEFNYQHLRRNLSMTMSMGLSAMWVTKREGKIVGAICGMLYPDVFTGDLIAVENFWFVTKDCRGTDGLRLLGEFEAWAKENGAKRIVVAHMANIHPESMSAFYERRGFKALETNYVMEVE